MKIKVPLSSPIFKQLQKEQHPEIFRKAMLRNITAKQVPHGFIWSPYPPEALAQRLIMCAASGHNWPLACKTVS